MYCPICRTEYLENVGHCVDCGEALVDQLPEIIPPGYHEYETLLSTFSPADIAIIKSLLDDSEIDYYFHGENSSFMQPFAVPAILMVRKDQASDARTLLKDLPILYSIHLRETAGGQRAK
jgi:hypothetical protein